MKKAEFQELCTPFEFDKAAPWQEYPRPQLRRELYISLCGPWELYSEIGGSVRPIGSITVPFAPESALSGICREKAAGEKYIYEKTFFISENTEGKRILLHFGAVDAIAQVFINGNLKGEDIGGYLPFTIEATDCICNGENTLRVIVSDELDPDLPYGKQRKDRGGMWYTPVCGIWQSVWIEVVPKSYIKGIRLTPNLDRVRIEVIGGDLTKRITLPLPEGEKEYTFEGTEFLLKLDDPLLWSPESPHLYDFTLECGEDDHCITLSTLLCKFF